MPSSYIDREECIGDSLVKLNSNFSGLDADIINVNTRVTNTSAAAITLTTNLSTNLENTSPGMAKAWVNFNGNNVSLIYGRYNIQSVTGSGGVYTITYSKPVGNLTCVIATAKDDSGGYTACVQSQSSTSCQINTFRTSPLNTAANSNINIVVFGF